MMVFTFLIPVRSGHGPHLNFSLLQTVIRGACGEVNQVTAAERSHFQISAHKKKKCAASCIYSLNSRNRTVVTN